MRRIKVWGGTHPNEQISLDVADSLIQDPIPNISAGIVNEEARQRGNRRMVDVNMNSAYPGDVNSSISEERRASGVLAESLGYFAVIDLHGNNYRGEDTAYIGSKGVRPEVLGFIAMMGLRRLVLTSHNSLSEHIDNGFLLEINHDSYRADVAYLRACFDYFANESRLPKAEPDHFEWFSFVADLYVEQAPPPVSFPDIKPFETIPKDIAYEMGYSDTEICALLLAPDATSGCWAEICTPTPTPWDLMERAV